MGDRNGSKSRQPSSEKISRQRDSPARARPLYVRDDVSHRAAKSRVGDGKHHRRKRRQRNCCRRRNKKMGVGRARKNDFDDREKVELDI